MYEQKSLQSQNDTSPGPNVTRDTTRNTTQETGAHGARNDLNTRTGNAGNVTGAAGANVLWNNQYAVLMDNDNETTA